MDVAFAMEDVQESPNKPLEEGSMPRRAGPDEASFSTGKPKESQKRKIHGTGHVSDADLTPVARLDDGDGRNGMQKKPRLDPEGGSLAPTQVFRAPQDRSYLPPEIWHRIFTFLPPRALGSLLRVNKLFHTFLDPASAFVAANQAPPLSASVAKAMEPNDIWRRSRRTFWPKAPGPFKDMTELDMWRLAYSSTCQFCGKKDTSPRLPSFNPYRYGPGADGVARVWEFRVRCCGSCLSRKTIKEMDLIMSTASTFLMPALQFVFATSNNCIIPLSIIQSAKLPPNETLTKLFWAPDVESLREEFASVKDLGAAAADEWQKGLSARGSRQRADIAKWQKYADAGSAMRARSHPNQKLPKAGRANLQLSTPSHSNPSSSLPNSTSGSSVYAARQDRPADSSSSQLVKLEALESALCLPAIPRGKPAEIVQPIVNSEKTKEEIDAEWDEIQGPVRLKILKYADEAIAGDWDDGDKVTKENAPSFAADVLLHVRKRFYRHVEKEANAARAAGQRPVVDPPEGPFTQKLSLENMKYVFDVKVKPITGNLRKELFLCNDCTYNGKFYGFEGVIQHFAAKHTSVLSSGSIIVHWRAEWPEYPPFKANPRPPKPNSQLTLPAKPPSSRNARVPTARHSLDFNQTGAQSSPGHPPALEHMPRPQVPQYLPQHAAASHRPPAQAIEIYGAAYPSPGPPKAPPSTLGPFPPAGAYPMSGPPYQPPFYDDRAQVQDYSQSQPGLGPYPGHPAPLYHNGGYGRAAPELPEDYRINAAAQSHAAASHPAPASMEGNQAPATTAGYALGHRAIGHAENFQIADENTKLDELAKHAAELWKATEDMRRLPAMVRRYTIHFHLSIYYKKRFNEPLSLRMFSKCLLSRDGMLPMRSERVKALCKACQLPGGHKNKSKGKSRMFLFQHLVTHFMQEHADAAQNGKGERRKPSRNWLTDMLVIPNADVLASMAGSQGKHFPLLFASIQDLLAGHTSDGAAAGQNDHDNGVGRAHGITKRDSKHLDKTDPGRATKRSRHKESDIVLKREVSLEAAFPNNRQAPVRPHHTTRAVAAPQASEQDILGALETHLNGEPAVDSPIQDALPRRGGDMASAHGEMRQPIYEARDDGAQRGRVVSFDPRYTPQEDEAYMRRQTDHAGSNIRTGRVQSAQDVPQRSQSRAAYDRAMQPRPPQYRERSPLPQRSYIVEPVQGDSGLVYEYDDRGQAPQPPAHRYVRAPPRHEYYGRYADEDVQAAPARVEYEPYEAYEVVRVSHPDGDYLVRRPVRRETVVPADVYAERYYYRPTAAPVYADTERQQVGRQGYEQVYRGDAAGYARAPPQTLETAFETYATFNEAPVYSRAQRSENPARDVRARTAAPVAAQPDAAQRNAPLYEEYDPHYPSAAAGQR